MKLLLPVLLLACGAVSAAVQVVNSFDVPDTGVSGMAYAQGSLYVVCSSSKLYKLDPVTGAVQNMFTVSATSPDGLGYAGDLLYVTDGTSNVYKYALTGTSQGISALYCPG